MFSFCWIPLFLESVDYFCVRVNGFNGEFFRKYEKAFDFRWVLVKSRICIRNTNNRVTANYKVSRVTTE